jgi:hypothetical protein
MFCIDPKTWDAVLHQGNTGAQTIKVKAKSASLLISQNDVIYMRVADSADGTVFERVLPIEAHVAEDLSTGYSVTIVITHEESAALPVGAYHWDLTCWINPAYDSTGHLTDGTVVETPIRQRLFSVLPVVSKGAA